MKKKDNVNTKILVLRNIHSSKSALITKQNCPFKDQANTLLEFNLLTITSGAFYLVLSLIFLSENRFLWKRDWRGIIKKIREQNEFTSFCVSNWWGLNCSFFFFNLICHLFFGIISQIETYWQTNGSYFVTKKGRIDIFFWG